MQANIMICIPPIPRICCTITNCLFVYIVYWSLSILNCNVSNCPYIECVLICSICFSHHPVRPIMYNTLCIDGQVSGHCPVRSAVPLMAGRVCLTWTLEFSTLDAGGLSCAFLTQAAPHIWEVHVQVQLSC